MRRRVIAIGVAAGLAIGATILLYERPQRALLLHATPEEMGSPRCVVMHYAPAAGPVVTPIYRELLHTISPDVQVVWVCASQPDADDLRSRLGDDWPAGRCDLVLTGKPITTWAKDRFVALTGEASGAFAPARETAALAERTNDQEVPYLLAQHWRGRFVCRSSPLQFDGGDFLATRRFVLVHPLVRERNLARADAPFANAAELESHLADRLGVPIVWLADRADQLPDHHVGMFVTILGERACVGDPRLVDADDERVRSAAGAGGGLLDATGRELLARQLDTVAARLAACGLTLFRVPLIPASNHRAWMSYNNGIVDVCDRRTIYYMPTFGVADVDDRAAAIFRANGCQVQRIDCSRTWPAGGSLHCLVNVTDRR